MNRSGIGSRPRPTLPGRALLQATWSRHASVIALVLLSFGLRLWRLEAKGIWWDESLSLFRAQQTVPYILSSRIDFPGSSSTDQHPPLYFLLLHGAIGLWGESDLVLRLPSVFFATIAVPLLYAMGVRLRGSGVGLLAALFGALSPFYLWYAQEARMYTMVTALALAATWSLWRARTERKWIWGLASGLLACLGVATQYLFALLVACALLLSLFLWPRRVSTEASPPESRRVRHLAALACAIAILLVALTVAIRRVAQLLPTLWVGRRYVSPSVMIGDALNSFSLGLSVSLWKVWWIDLGFAAIYLAGVVSLWRRPPPIGTENDPVSAGRRRGAGLITVVAYIVVPMVCIWAFSLFVPVYSNSRYLIMSSPAFYLGLALGVSAAARWRRELAFLLVAALVVSMGASTQAYFFKERYQAKEDYRSAARFVMANERTRDAIVVAGPESLPAFMHYYRGDLPVIGMPRDGPDRIGEELTGLGRSYDRLWLMHGRTLVSDAHDLVAGWIGSNTMLLMRKTFPGYAGQITVSAHLPQSPVQEAGEAATWPGPLGSFGGRLSLLTYTIHYRSVAGEAREMAYPQVGRDREPAPVQDGVAPGRPVSVECIWRVLDGLGVYKTSLRLVDDRGLIWSQADHEPFMYLPTSEWPIGSVVRHETAVRIPPGTPPGAYTLQLWLYEKATGQPLAFDGPGEGESRGWVDLGQVVVAQGQWEWAEDAFLLPGVRRPRPRAVFGGRLELMAFGQLPQATRAGGTLDLQLYWRARRAPRENCDLVVNWADEEGRVWHTATHNLVSEDYATSRWRQGEMVRGLVRLTVPADAPPGTQEIHLLVRSRESGRYLWLGRGWLPWTGRDLAIGEVTIEP